MNHDRKKPRAVVKQNQTHIVKNKSAKIADKKGPGNMWTPKFRMN
jgi:hypothetical protein